MYSTFCLRIDLDWSRRKRMKYDLIKNTEESLSLEELIFSNRNIPLKTINNFKHPTSSDLLDYRLLKNIEHASALLIEHINRGSRIFLQVDSDCDGYTSSSILMNWIYRYNKNFEVSFRLHEGKQHGLSQQLVDGIVSEGYNLVIIPDAGSNQIDLHKTLFDSGIGCIILDHHECDEESPYAVVVNPQIDDYPNKGLSGAGVVYKFCKALDHLTQNDFADNFLDLAAVGMIADMVDAKDLEIRYIFQEGLSNIRNRFLKALVEKQAYSMRNEITPITIGFYIAPLINATVRVGSPEEKMLVFKSLLDSSEKETVSSGKRGSAGKPEPIVVEAVRVITNVRARQNKARDSAFEKIESKIREQGLDKNKIISVVVSPEEDIDKNISGLIANKLTSKYQKPVLILRRRDNGFLEGSGRGYEKSEFVDFKSFLNSSGITDYAEGHANAFGVKVEESRLSELVDYSNLQLQDVDFSRGYLVDRIFTGSQLKDSDVYTVTSLRNLWSKGFEEPVFAIEDLKIKKESITLLSADKNPTLKLEFKNISFMKFGVSLEEYKKLTSASLVSLNIIGRFSINEWQGEISPQVLIEDYEIKEFQKYYF